MSEIEFKVFSQWGEDGLIQYLLRYIHIKNPIFGTKPYVRVDMPNDPRYMFKAHQDYPYNRNSKNSIVIFIHIIGSGYR